MITQLQQLLWIHLVVPIIDLLLIHCVEDVWHALSSDWHDVMQLIGYLTRAASCPIISHGGENLTQARDV